MASHTQIARVVGTFIYVPEATKNHCYATALNMANEMYGRPQAAPAVLGDIDQCRDALAIYFPAATQPPALTGPMRQMVDEVLLIYVPANIMLQQAQAAAQLLQLQAAANAANHPGPGVNVVVENAEVLQENARNHNMHGYKFPRLPIAAYEWMYPQTYINLTLPNPTDHSYLQLFETFARQRLLYVAVPPAAMHKNKNARYEDLLMIWFKTWLVAGVTLAALPAIALKAWFAIICLFLELHILTLKYTAITATPSEVTDRFFAEVEKAFEGNKVLSFHTFITTAKEMKKGT